MPLTLTLAQHESLLIVNAAMLLGFLLLCGTLCGWVAHILRVPRVVGFLLAGSAVNLSLGILGSGDAQPHPLTGAAELLKPIKNLALGLILFSIGGVYEVRHVRAVYRSVFPLALGESGLTALFVTAAMTVALVITGAAESIGSASWLALLFGLAAVATAPAATLFVLREYEAKGPTTDLTLNLVGINNVTCIVTFHVTFMILAATGVFGQSNAMPSRDLWLHLSVGILGSSLLGLALGIALSVIHAKFLSGETLVMLLAGLVMLGAGEQWILDNEQPSYNFLLTCICMGAVFANVAIDPNRLESSVRSVEGPILVSFFVLAGFNLHLNELFELRWLGAIGVYVAARTAGKVIGSWLGWRMAGRVTTIQPLLGAGLLCQAAVVIGLAEFIRNWGDAPAESTFAMTFATIVLGSVVIFELCGPILTKWVVVRAGEVKAVTLLRRAGPAVTGKDSILALTLVALQRTVGIGPGKSARDPKSLRVHHLMRTNIKCLKTEAGLDEVLHFIERSSDNDFPVVDDRGEYVGLIRYRDIRELIYDPTLSKLLTAIDMADAEFSPISGDLPLEEALRCFHDQDVGLLPIVERGGSRRVIGILEQRDLLRAMHLSRSDL